MRDIFEALMIGDVVDDDDAVGASIITVGNGPETLLPCGVPLYYRMSYQHQFAFLSIHINVLDFLLHKNKSTKSTPMVLRKF